MSYVDEDWAEMHGYQRFFCPTCRVHFWSDTGPDEHRNCGRDPDEDTGDDFCSTCHEHWRKCIC